MRSITNPALRSWEIALVVIVIDQAVKAAIEPWIGRGAERHTHWLVGDWLGFAYAENRGVAFGLMRGQSTAALLIAAAVVLAVVGAFAYAWRTHRLVAIGCGLIIGGAAGNLGDRARFGYVRDFVAVWRWPSFNVADAAITCGVAVVMLGMLAAETTGRSTTDRVGVNHQQIMETSE